MVPLQLAPGFAKKRNAQGCKLSSFAQPILTLSAKTYYQASAQAQSCVLLSLLTIHLIVNAQIHTIHVQPVLGIWLLVVSSTQGAEFALGDSVEFETAGASLGDGRVVLLDGDQAMVRDTTGRIRMVKTRDLFPPGSRQANQ